VGIILMILFWAAVILVLVAAIRWLMGGHREGPGPLGAGHRTALEILEERFARGEIEREEFEERRRLLSGRD